MVVVKRVSSLSLPLFHGCCGRRSVLLADDRRQPISHGRLRGFRMLPARRSFFLTPAYTPEFYIDKLWLSENHVFFTIMIFLGLPFCWAPAWISLCFHGTCYAVVPPHEFPGRFVSTLLLLLSAALILAGTAAAITLYDRLVSLAHRAGNATVARVAAHATGLAVMTLLFLQSNESVMKEYTLSSKGDATDTHDSHEYVPLRLPRRGGLCKESLPAGRPDYSRHSTRVRVVRGNARGLFDGYSPRHENRI